MFSKAAFFVLAALCGLPFAAQASSTYEALHQFRGKGDGRLPLSVLVRDENGNLYGTTKWGGSALCTDAIGCGTIFKMTRDGALTVLHVFKGGKDGAFPESGLVVDSKGTMYGTAERGGGDGCSGEGCGIVFKITKRGKYKIIHSFQGGSVDGSRPMAKMAVGPDGNLYGTTTQDGGTQGCFGTGCGIVFKLTPHGHETILHRFTGDADGADSQGGLAFDAAGNLYGATVIGGDMQCSAGAGCGAIFKIAPDGQKSTFYAFEGPGVSDGQLATGDLTFDGAGNLYGTTEQGGSHILGMVFKITPQGHETNLHSFGGPTDNDGAFPRGNVLVDAAGNLYGTTTADDFNDLNGHGVVYKIASDGTYTVLLHFTHTNQGKGAVGLVSDGAGTFYGAMDGGGVPKTCGQDGCGLIYRFTP